MWSSETSRRANIRVLCGTCGKIYHPNRRQCPNCKKIEERNDKVNV